MTINETKNPKMNTEFAKDILQGLSENPKSLPSKYFYDTKGDKLFQDIMHMDEYYLTNCEFEIFTNQKEALTKSFTDGSNAPFELVEFGAGDGLKTKVLLRHMVASEVDFTYMPIDISANALSKLTQSLKSEIQALHVKGIENDYFKALHDLQNDGKKKVVLFLGSNIGNLTLAEAKGFLNHLSENLNKGDKLLIGMDLKKDPQVILDAYNDKAGITSSFNLNLLERINEELDADFDVEAFQHFPNYDPITGQTKSYLISKKEQVVKLKGIEEEIKFEAWEPIYMELSRKYDLKEIEALAHESGFEISKHFFDKRNYFVDSLWEKQ
ncbi:L-histidine N(alpha)-methyltransferase [Limibacter armeniacum]|uniref:L-histidine N(alpha)-methyltransferase n=1 Tax=Limibacter armeniacum TaxID=466084 RepID=UPI002FE5A204